MPTGRPRQHRPRGGERRGLRQRDPSASTRTSWRPISTARRSAEPWRTCSPSCWGRAPAVRSHGRRPEGVIVDAQLVEVSNNPYTLCSVIGSASRPAGHGRAGVASLVVGRPSDVNRLVALEISGHPERFEGWRQWTAAQLQVRGRAAGRRHRRRGADAGASACLRNPAALAAGSHCRRAKGGLPGVPPGTRGRVHAGGPAPCSPWPAERDCGPLRDGGSVTAPVRSERTEGRSSVPPGEVPRRLLDEADALDHAVDDAVARTPTPTMDVLMARLSDAANYSGLWLVIAGAMALAGGRAGRSAAVRGLLAIGVASVTANLAAKNVFPRSRPDRSAVPRRAMRACRGQGRSPQATRPRPSPSRRP